MKLNLVFVFGLGAALSGLSAQAQPNGPDRPPRGGPPPMPPLMRALDTNCDGVIDAGEIANASAALLKLDLNGDGKLTADELRPPRPSGTSENRFGPPPGFRHPRGPLMMALDANHDGELDASEIANASNALLKLDKNGDGKLTRDELRPPGRGPRGGAFRPPPGANDQSAQPGTGQLSDQGNPADPGEMEPPPGGPDEGPQGPPPPEEPGSN
jgi:hypothetical protein